MITSIPNVLTLSLGLFGLVRAQTDAALVGTWSTKSKKVVTGPVSLYEPGDLVGGRILMRLLIQGFYDPVADKLIEPDLAGISYSFTADGFYEEAYYRALANRTFKPHKPKDQVDTRSKLKIQTNKY